MVISFLSVISFIFSIGLCHRSVDSIVQNSRDETSSGQEVGNTSFSVQRDVKDRPETFSSLFQNEI